MNSELSCNCAMYWFEEARRESRLPAKFSRLRCASSEPTFLDALRLVDMVRGGFRASPSGAATPSDTYERSSFTGVLADRGLGLPGELQLRLEARPQHHAGALRRRRPDRAAPPARRAAQRRAPGPGALRQSAHRPAGGRVASDDRGRTSFPSSREAPRGRLPRGAQKPTAALQEIDLRNNSIGGAGSAAGAAALLARVRAVQLAGNPLRCACSEPLLHLLRAAAVRDFGALRCAGGRSAAEAAAQCAAQGWAFGRGWAWALGALGAAGALLAAAALALRRAVRLRLKTFLLARGLCLRWVNFDDDDCVYVLLAIARLICAPNYLLKNIGKRLDIST